MYYLALGIIIIVVLTLLFTLLFDTEKHVKEKENLKNSEECCGAHDICDKDSLLSSDDKIEYFEDEELDRFKNKDATEYLPEEIEEFSEVLLTLQENEVASWMKSLQLRSINMPTTTRNDALLIVSERRFNSHT